MPRHDSLNLREVVTLPINYEGTLSSCRDKPGSIASASEALPLLVGYRPGPRVEWDFNPPETCAARRTVRAVKRLNKSKRFKGAHKFIQKQSRSS